MPSDKNNTSGFITADTATSSEDNPEAQPLPTFKIPISTTQSHPQLSQTLNKPTPPSTPPHDNQYINPQSPPLSMSQPTAKVQGRRLSIDRPPILVPKTPDHLNLNNGFDNTPLQSPTKTPRSVKRRSTDTYNLLKTPDHKIHGSSRIHLDDEDDESDEKASQQSKRSSLEFYKLLNSEDNKVKLVQLSPKKASSTAVFHDTATSPVKNTYRVKKSDTEIKELSNNLKSRLNYAFLKVQHGWTEKPLAELEKSPLKSSLASPPRESTRPRSLHIQSPSTTSESHFPNRVRLDDFASSRSHRSAISSSQANANVALITALSPRQPPKHETDPEKTAAMSLMKLSSPIKSSATISFQPSSTHSSPTRPVIHEKPTGNQLGEEEEEDNKTETEVEEDDVLMTNEKTDDDDDLSE